MRCTIQMGLLALSCLVPLVSGGCLTSALWNTINPEDLVWVPSSKVTEAELVKDGREYKPEGDPVTGYYVAKTDLQKFGDYAILATLTPITVVIDVAVVCATVYACLAGTACCCP